MSGVYQRLPTSADTSSGPQPNNDFQHVTLRATSHTWPDRIAVLSCITAVVSLLSTLAFINAPALWGRAVSPSVLRRPSPYIGLQHIVFPANATFDPIVNYPLVAYQIDPFDSSRALSEDEIRFVTPEGALVKQAQHIVVSAKNSTVVQFRAMDWGFEKCTLHINIPVTAEVTLEIWSLGDTAELLPHIGGREAPRRLDLWASVRLLPNHTAVKVDFLCRSGSFPTYEISCSAETHRCGVDLWQDMTETNEKGIYIVQEWSLS